MVSEMRIAKTCLSRCHSPLVSVVSRINLSRDKCTRITLWFHTRRVTVGLRCKSIFLKVALDSSRRSLRVWNARARVSRTRVWVLRVRIGWPVRACFSVDSDHQSSNSSAFHCHPYGSWQIPPVSAFSCLIAPSTAPRLNVLIKKILMTVKLQA